jgi:molecular chaperone GrpE
MCDTNNKQEEISKDQETINQEIESLNQKVLDYEDLLKRTQADFVNYKARVTKDVQDIVFLQTKAIALEMLSFKELFLLSMKNEEHEETKKVLELLLEKIDGSLVRLKIEKIKLNEGVPDYNLCECVSTLQTKNKEDDNKIITVLEDGYFYNNKLIKPVKVIIGKLEE